MVAHLTFLRDFVHQDRDPDTTCSQHPYDSRPTSSRQTHDVSLSPSPNAYDDKADENDRRTRCKAPARPDEALQYAQLPFLDACAGINEYIAGFSRGDERTFPRQGSFVAGTPVSVPRKSRK